MSEKTENDKSMGVDMTKYYEGQNNEIMREMKELMSGNRLKFLIGAGCSVGAGLPLIKDLTDKILKKLEGNETMNRILQVFDGEKHRSIERYMSAIVGYQSIIDKMEQSGIDNPSIICGDSNEKVKAMDLYNLLDEIKREIIKIIERTAEEESDDKELINIHDHRRFVRGIHKHLSAGKKGKSVDYFVLNYDTLIEDALGLEEIPYQDGFEGSATGWWNPGLLEEKSDCARVFKIHGSIDWCLLNNESSTPKRIRKQIKTGEQLPVLIYPASTKYQEVQRDPFDTMITNMRNTLSKSKQTVLIICGYSFSDSHINAVIEDGIRASDEKLTVMAFINDDETMKRLEEWKNPDISDQIKIYAKNGVFHGKQDEEGKNPKGEGSFEWGEFRVLSSLIGGDEV